MIFCFLYFVLSPSPPNHYRHYPDRVECFDLFILYISLEPFLFYFGPFCKIFLWYIFKEKTTKKNKQNQQQHLFIQWQDMSKSWIFFILFCDCASSFFFFTFYWHNDNFISFISPSPYLLNASTCNWIFKNIFSRNPITWIPPFKTKK